VGERPFGITYGRGAVWVSNNGDDTVTRIDAGSLNTVPIRVGRGPKGISVGAAGVWTANAFDSTVTRIDPQTNRVSRRAIKVAINPYGIDATPDQVWVTSLAEGKVQRLTP
jgi:DNA-binding beta-propeller fold protein YncE